MSYQLDVTEGKLKAQESVPLKSAKKDVLMWIQLTDIKRFYEELVKLKQNDPSLVGYNQDLIRYKGGVYLCLRFSSFPTLSEYLHDRSCLEDRIDRTAAVYLNREKSMSIVHT